MKRKNVSRRAGIKRDQTILKYCHVESHSLLYCECCHVQRMYEYFMVRKLWI